MTGGVREGRCEKREGDGERGVLDVADLGLEDYGLLVVLVVDRGFESLDEDPAAAVPRELCGEKRERTRTCVWK